MTYQTLPIFFFLERYLDISYRSTILLCQAFFGKVKRHSNVIQCRSPAAAIKGTQLGFDIWPYSGKLFSNLALTVTQIRTRFSYLLSLIFFKERAEYSLKITS